jgi:endosialidase-like protein
MFVMPTAVMHHGGSHHGGGKHHSDIRLKEDIVPPVRLDNGLELYRFRYKGNDHTDYVGVMAQEVKEIEPSSVWRDRDGYLVVDYDRLGLKFMTWDEWLARTSVNYQSVH